MSGFPEGAFDREKVSGWARRFCPAQAFFSLLDVDPAKLVSEGKKLVLLDVDNTLLPWRSEEIPLSTIDWIADARKHGLDLCILSNTRHPARLKRIADRLGVEFLVGKFKPNPSIYRQALEKFGVSTEQAVMLGDQVFTDVWGANRAEIESVWLKPMTSRDFVGTKVSRLGERLIMGALKRGLESEDAKEGGGILKVPVVRQFIKFAIVGGTSTFVDLGLHALLMFYLPYGDGSLGDAFGGWLIRSFPGMFGFANVPSDAAFPIFKVLSASIAILNSFYWNRRWTFRIRGKEERYTQLRRFVIVSLIGMGLNTLIATGMNNIVAGHPKRSWAVASAIATVVVAFWNFTGQKYFAFRGAHGASKPVASTSEAEA